MTEPPFTPFIRAEIIMSGKPSPSKSPAEETAVPKRIVDELPTMIKPSLDVI
eukprot:gene5126-5492_t